MIGILVGASVVLAAIVFGATVVLEILTYRHNEKQRIERLKELDSILEAWCDMHPKITVDVEGAGDLVPGTAGHGGGGAQ
jgi:hypothetical protein